MKKKIIKSFVILSIILGLTACGSGEGEQQDILPSRIEQIDQGGVIPEGHEAKVESESKYTLDMLWGTWVLKGSKDEEVHVSDKTINIGDGKTEKSVEVECFPKRMSFNPAWAGVSTGMGSGRSLAESNLSAARDNSTLVFGQKIYSSEIVVAEETMGNALEANGYGMGGIEFQSIEGGNSLDALAYGSRKIAYAIHGDVLAIGVTDAGVYDELSETDILEIDYMMSLKGYELELTYNGETAVYVPEQIEGNAFAVNSYPGFHMENAGITNNYEELDHIKGITLLPEGYEAYDHKNTNYYSGSRMMFDIHEGFVDASFEFREDGTVTVNSSKGDTYEYEYFYSGDALTLMSDNQTAVYSLYNYVLESQNVTPTHTFYVDGNEVRLGGAESVASLLERGFTTNVDMSQPIASCQITDEIEFIYQGAKLKIKAINPYEKTIALGQCSVCYYCINDTSGIIQKGDGSEIGVTTYEEIDMMYAPYEKTAELLRYKGTTSGIIIADFDEFGTGLLQDNAQVLETSGLEIIYEFENGILTKIAIEDSALLYHGLHDNVDRSLLAQMEPEQFTGIMQIRNTILDRLKAAFADAGIEVNVNELTGEILMDNDILFGVDEYEISDAGKQYIDRFMGVYASVITAEEFSDYISEVLFEGHTDSTGSYGYNLILSQKRAESVLNYCINSNYNGLDDIQKSKLQDLAAAIGHSSSDPILNENGKEDMDASRRVAIKFFINVENTKNVNVDKNAETSTDLEVNVQEETDVVKDKTDSGNLDMSDITELLGDSSIVLMERTAESPFMWNLPLSLETFSYEGWTLDGGLDEPIEPGYWGKSLSKNSSSIDVILFNESEAPLPAGECVVIAVIVDNTMNTYAAIKGGIDLNSTAEEINSVYGASAEVLEESGYIFITYTNNQSIHFVKGNNYSGILFTAVDFVYGTENIFYEALNAE